MVYRQRIDRPHPAVIFCAPREPLLALEVAMGMGMERWNPRRETGLVDDGPLAPAGPADPFARQVAGGRHGLAELVEVVSQGGFLGTTRRRPAAELLETRAF